MAIIHKGFIDKRFHDSFKDTDLNDVDIATTKMYNGVKPMWQQLGFDYVSSDNPESKYYWKNIIPKDYKLKPQNIFGIEVKTVVADDDIGVTSGNKTPRNSYKKIEIDEEVSQDWKGNQQPYYPPIPRINKFGLFSDVVDEDKFYGSKKTWDGDDDSAPITNLDESDNNLILNIDYSVNLSDDLIDKIDLNEIQYVQDYQMDLKDNRLDSDTIVIPDGMEKENTKQAF